MGIRGMAPKAALQSVPEAYVDYVHGQNMAACFFDSFCNLHPVLTIGQLDTEVLGKPMGAYFISLHPKWCFHSLDVST